MLVPPLASVLPLYAAAVAGEGADPNPALRAAAWVRRGRGRLFTGAWLAPF